VKEGQNSQSTTLIANHLRSLEEQLLQPAFRRNTDLLASIIADDFIELGGSGRVFDKSSILEHLKNESPRPASLLADFKTRELAPGVILATYKITTRNAAEEPVSQSRRSSIWSHVHGQWQITFHQGTPIPPPLDPAQK
jgi:hypothetical protein